MLNAGSSLCTGWPPTRECLARTCSAALTLGFVALGARPKNSNTASRNETEERLSWGGRGDWSKELKWEE